MAKKSNTSTAVEVTQPETGRESQNSGSDPTAQKLPAESPNGPLGNPHQRPRSSSAAVNANYLNAARQAPAASSSATTAATASKNATMAPKEKGLSAPNFLGANVPRLVASRPNQIKRDVYAFPESPDRNNQDSLLRILPDIVNKKPLKRLKRAKKPQAGDEQQEKVLAIADAQIAEVGDAGDEAPASPGGDTANRAEMDDEHQENIAEPADDRQPISVLEDRPPIPSSPSPSLPIIEPVEATSHQRQSGRMGGAVEDTAEIDLAKKSRNGHGKSKPKSDHQQHNVERRTKSPARETRSISRVPPTGNQAFSVADLYVGAEKVPEERENTDHVPTRRSKSKAHNPSNSTRNRQSAPEQEAAVPSMYMKHRRAKTAPPSSDLAVRTKPNGRGAIRRSKDPIPDKDGDVEMDRREPNISELGNSVLLPDTDGPEQDEKASLGENEGEDVEADKEEDNGEEEEAAKEEGEGDVGKDKEEQEAQDSLQQVFKFLDTQARPGRCQTDDGAAIKTKCIAARKLTAEPKITLEAISASSKSIRAILANFGADRSTKQRKALKGDAYGYVFRYLTQYLENLYDWLEEKYTVTESITAMRVIAPFIHDMVALIDRITSWDVSVTARFKGNCLVQDVNENLVAPLRIVDEEFHAVLATLKASRTHEELTRKRQRRLDEYREKERKKAKYAQVAGEKWEQWQHLHFERIRCEPIVSMRRHLHIMSREKFNSWLEQAEERDANGARFERVPVFRQRDSRPPRRSELAAEPEWTDEQLAGLIEGLSKYEGSDVFPWIFRNYCGSGRPLRNFNVLEITTKAASLRFDLLERYRGEGWQVPEWINKIPVLP
ncbi:hypothetical protein P280DRAFT_192569 [Massarina eburnea CBS 473.64]|uniref:Uncharacterized protein n=1 Tax=Massarina eburnea CBS 473.64 TaxID=1395130 RepID=A0A6A6RJY0_9PLEO|nr:hypothetical protein P280DRAFT_192569 [Massarina eburnea CBS 473.64]